MSNDKKSFDAAIVEEAEKALSALLEHKELKSVGLVFNWNLPPAAAAAFPSGMWKSQSEAHPVEALVGLQSQMPNMMLHIAKLVIEATTKNLPKVDKPDKKD
jgi:hypothetical protein